MLHIPAKLERVNSELKTKTNIVFSTTSELSEIEIEQLKGSWGHLVFSHDELKKTVEEKIKSKGIGVDYNGKTPSQKMRGLLYEIALELGKDGDAYYIEVMGKQIEKCKAKLSELRRPPIAEPPPY